MIELVRAGRTPSQLSRLPEPRYNLLTVHS